MKKLFFRLSLLIAFCYGGINASNQTDRKVDLQSYLRHAKSYEKQYNYAAARLTYDSAIAIAQYREDALWLAQLYRLKGRSYIFSDQNDSAVIFLEDAVQIADSLDIDTILAMAYINIGNIMHDWGLPDSSVYYYKESRALYASAGDSIGVGKTYSSLAIHYKYSGDFEKGIENALKANIIFKKFDRTESYVRSLINLGNIYEKLRENDTALSCYKLSYKLSKKNNLPVLAAISLMNRGIIFYNYGIGEKINGETGKALIRFEQAKSEFLKAMEFSKSINDQKRLAQLYSNISLCNKKLGNIKEAINYARDAVTIFKELGNINGLIFALNSLGSCYEYNEDYQKAKACYFESLELAKKAKQKEAIKKTSFNLSNVYNLQGDYKKALEYYRLSADYQDSLFNEKKQKLIEEHKTQYEILHLKDMNRIKELDKKRMRAVRNVTLWVSVFVVVVLLGSLLFMRMRARKNQIIAAQKIQKLEDEKKLMAAQSVLVGQEKERERIARELHDGIGVLLSTASIHFSSVETKTDKATGEMLKKANKLLKEASKEIRQISHNMMPGVLSKFGLKEAIEDLFEEVEDASDAKVDLRLYMGEERLPESMEIMIYRVVQEMLNNTLKHTKASKITFSFSKEDGMISMEYTDDGVGFYEEKLPQGKNLGLSGIRSRIDYLGGKLKMESRPGEGTRYSIIIPLNVKNG